MRVLVYTSLYPNNVRPDHGVFIQQRVAHVARLPGYEVRVVAPVPSAPPIPIGRYSAFRRIAASERRDGLEVLHPRYLLIPKVGMSLHAWSMFRGTLPAVSRLRREFQIDIVDAHYAYPDGAAAVRIGRALGRPVVVSARGSDINLFQHLFPIRGMLRRTLRDCQHVITVSEGLRGAVLDLGVSEEKVTVIPNGVDTARFHPCPRPEARESLGLPREGRLLLSVGHLVPNKGFDLLLDAFANLKSRRRGDRLSLAIVGEGPCRASLLRRIETLGVGDSVRLVGSVPHATLPPWFSAADILCSATEREGFPNVVLEALACGTPVVAPPVGGIPEIVRPEAHGYLPAREPGALAEALARALDRPWDREILRARALEYRWESTAQAVGRVFERVLSRWGQSFSGAERR